MVGLPQEFPAPNNMNRKLRSIANIERIGLFSPHDCKEFEKPESTILPNITDDTESPSVYHSLENTQSNYKYREEIQDNNMESSTKSRFASDASSLSSSCSSSSFETSFSFLN